MAIYYFIKTIFKNINIDKNGYLLLYKNNF